MIQPLFTWEKFVDQLQEKGFACWTETCKSADTITLTPEDPRMSFLHLTRDEFLSAFLINFPLDNISVQKILVPLIDRHVSRVKRGFLLHFFDELEEMQVVIWRKSWIG